MSTKDLKVDDDVIPGSKGKTLTEKEIQALDDAWESVFLLEERCVT